MRWGELVGAWLYAMIASVEAVLRELNQIKCHKCGCRHRRSINHQCIEQGGYANKPLTVDVTNETTDISGRYSL